MKIFQNLYKVFSYIFICFIVILITLTFGMPDFVSSSADADRYIAARIGDEVLTKIQVNRTKENFIRQKFTGKKLPENFKKNIEDQIFNQLIQNKVSLILMKKIGLYPIGRSKKSIMVSYLKENFPSYFTEIHQEFDRFDREILRRNRISYAELESDVIDNYANQYTFDLLKFIQVYSNLEKVLLWDTQQIKISYQIGILNKDKKNKILKSRNHLTETDIQKKFQSDYLSKDKHAKLTPIKRQAIENSFYQKKENQLETEFLKEIKASLKKTSIRTVASRYGLRIYSVNNVSLSAKLDDHKPANAPSMATLGKSSGFRDLLTFGKINQGHVISENNEFYLVSVTKKIIPKKKGRDEILKKVEMLKDFMEQNKKTIAKDSDQVVERYKSETTKMVTEIEKKKIKIKRFI